MWALAFMFILGIITSCEAFGASFLPRILGGGLILLGIVGWIGGGIVSCHSRLPPFLSALLPILSSATAIVSIGEGLVLWGRTMLWPLLGCLIALIASVHAQTAEATTRDTFRQLECRAPCLFGIFGIEDGPVGDGA